MEWVSEPDEGIYDAMNKGIKMSTGELIGIINAYDWYEKDTVNCIVNEYKHNGDIDVFHGNEYKRTTDGKYLCTNKLRINYNILWKGMILYHPTCFITKKYMKSGAYLIIIIKLQEIMNFCYVCMSIMQNLNIYLKS